MNLLRVVAIGRHGEIIHRITRIGCGLPPKLRGCVFGEGHFGGSLLWFINGAEWHGGFSFAQWALGSRFINAPVPFALRTIDWLILELPESLIVSHIAVPFSLANHFRQLLICFGGILGFESETFFEPNYLLIFRHKV